MSFIQQFPMPAAVARLKGGPAPCPTFRSPIRLLCGNSTRLAVVLCSVLALSGVAARAGAQTTYTCSTATPSSNCALSIPGGDSITNPPPAAAASNSSTLTVSGATGPVTSVKVVLQGVTSSIAKYMNTQTNQNTYSSVEWASFVLEDPAGNQLVLLGSTGSGTDPLDSATITVEDGAQVAPPTTNYNTAWPTSANATITVAPSSYWLSLGFQPLYDTSSSDWPPPDGSATLTGKYAGASANGTWTLHLADSNIELNYPDWVSDPISISGWQLILTYSTLPATTTTVSTSLNPSYTASPSDSVTLTATVVSTGNTVSGGTVAFTANGTTISGCGAQAVSGGTATCTTIFNAEGKYSIVAAYSGSGSYAGSNSSGEVLDQIAIDHTTNPSGNTYCNTGNLTTTGETASDLIYPSYIQVPNTVTQSVANVSVSMNGLQSSNGVSGAVSSTSFLLVSPGGTHNLDFISHVETASPQPSVDVTIADGNPLVPNGEGTNGGTCENGTGPYCVLQSTTYGPTDDSLQPDSFITQAGSPAPPSPNYPLPYGAANAETFEQAFSGATASGNWLLYVENDSGLALNVSGGWCIDLTLNTGAGTTTTVTSSKNPGTTGTAVSFTATVQSGGNLVNTGTVTFLDNGNPPTGGNNVITLNGSGQAVFTTSQLTEGDHKITASYGGGSEYDQSENYVWQRMDDASTVSLSSGVYSYCNTGAVLLPSPPANKGAYSPNPSNIFVAGLPGTISQVSLTLDNFYTYSDSVYEMESLVNGPAGAFDFFSMAGASNTVVSAGNYTFEDGQTEVPQADFAPGTYGPASYNGGADSFFSSSTPFYPAPTTINYAAPHGTSSFDSLFGGTNGNGTWGLFFNQTNNTSEEGAQNGWCLGFKENPVTVTAQASHNGNFVAGEQGAQITASISVADNTGPTGDPAGSNPLTLTDVLNSALTYSSASGSGWSCSAAGQTVTCTNHGAVAQGGSYPELTLNVNVSGTASGTISNSVSVSGAGITSTTSGTDSISVLANTTTSASNSEGEYGVTAVPLQATVTTSSGTVNSGSVTFTLFSGSNQVGTPTSGAVSNGVASVLYTLPPGTPPGSYTIQAVYSGSSSFAGSSDNTHTLTMAQAPTTTSASNATTNYSSSPQSVSLSATVTSTVGTVNAGTVTFTVLNSGVPVGTATTSGTVSGGNASVSYTLPAGAAVGTYTIQAAYNGSTDFSTSTDSSHTLSVSASTTTVASDARAAFSASNQAVTLSATVTSSEGTVSSGTVTFSVFQGATQIGAATSPANVTNGSASASYTLPGGTSVGIYSIVASYTGAGGFTSSSDNTHLLAVTSASSCTTSNPNPNPNPAVFAATEDFNGDCRSDILWQNSSTQQVYEWLMNGTTIASSGSPYTPTSDWVIQGVGDFDGDGKSDILWRNTGSGEVYIWLMNGTTIESGGSPYTVADPTWIIQGVGDFDGDGKSDILWRNTTTGEIYIWLMNGITIKSSGSPYTLADSTWVIQGVGDFDGDGKSDILWRNSNSGEVYIWLMNGTTIASSGSPYTVADPTWVIQGVGDFDGDGKSDILWRNSNSGEVYIWLMNGTTIASSGSPYTLADSTWVVQGTGDYDGSGRAGILWHNSTTQQVYIWLMNGTTLASSGSPGTLDNTWHIYPLSP